MEHRVAHHLLDMAAVEYEHGHEDVGDILTAEANMLNADDLAALLALAQTAAAPAALNALEVTSLEDLRITVAVRTLRAKARNRAEALIAEAWLREGYSEPQEITPVEPAAA